MIGKGFQVGTLDAAHGVSYGSTRTSTTTFLVSLCQLLLIWIRPRTVNVLASIVRQLAETVVKSSDALTTLARIVAKLDVCVFFSLCFLPWALFVVFALKLRNCETVWRVRTTGSDPDFSKKQVIAMLWDARVLCFLFFVFVFFSSFNNVVHYQWTVNISSGVVKPECDLIYAVVAARFGISVPIFFFGTRV